MVRDYPPLAHMPLSPGSGFVRPGRPRRHLSFDSPALELMTDFAEIWAETTSQDTPIDDALEAMKSAGVRMLLVVDDAEEVIGLITATDIQGERPVQLTRETGIPHARISVGQMMTPQSAIEVLSFARVADATVGHVVTTLKQMRRQHALVVEVDSISGAQQVRGVFSTSEIAKRVGEQVASGGPVAETLAEIHRELGTGP